DFVDERGRWIDGQHEPRSRWMLELEPLRVQHQPRRTAHRPPLAVEDVAEHGVPERIQVQADLVPASGLDLHLEDIGLAQALPPPPARPRGAAARIDRHTSRAELAQRSLDRSLLLRDVT